MVFAIHQCELAIGIHVSPPSWTPFPPLSPPYSSMLSQSTGFRCPASHIRLALVICFTYGDIRVSMLLSQIIPPSPSPTEECFWECFWQCFFKFFIFGCTGSLLLWGSFSGCGEQGLLQLQCAGSSLRWRLLLQSMSSSVHGLQCLWPPGSRAQAQYLWCMDLIAPWHVGSSQIRDRAPVPCTARQMFRLCFYFTTEPAGKPLAMLLMEASCNFFLTWVMPFICLDSYISILSHGQSTDVIETTNYFPVSVLPFLLRIPN